MCAGAVHETREADEEREVDQFWAEQQLGALMRGAWVAVYREKQQLMESYARAHLVRVLF